MKTTVCIVCGEEGKKMRGKYCHPCDYKRNKDWFDNRHKKRKETNYYDGKTSYKYYTKARSFYGNKCMDCGWDKYIEVLQVHHIDENRKNNKISNLAVLCPTCHNTRHFLNSTGLFTSKKKDGDNQQPSVVEIQMKVQRLEVVFSACKDGEETSTSAQIYNIPMIW